MSPHDTLKSHIQAIVCADPGIRRADIGVALFRKGWPAKPRTRGINYRRAFRELANEGRIEWVCQGSRIVGYGPGRQQATSMSGDG